MFLHDVKIGKIISGVWVLYCPDGNQREPVSAESEPGK
jgi:hypothetical protein